MIKPVKRRLLMVSFALLGLSGSLYLIFDGLRDNLVFFYSPTEIKTKVLQAHQKVRVGGMVKPGSLVWTNNQKISFIITDYTTDMLVEYVGITPDLFREGQGAVAEGFLQAPGSFRAQTILAKHDENYMPPEVAQALSGGHGQKTLKEE
jgi:cytochrome c-type biogenesis protein CcmE